MHRNVRIITLEELNGILADRFPNEKVVVRLMEAFDPKTGEHVDDWVLDPDAQNDSPLPGVRSHDRFLSGRMDGTFFQYGQRDPAVAKWGQPELREEPKVVQQFGQRRLVGYVRVEFCESTGRVRVKQSSLSNGQVSLQEHDQSVEFFRTNQARIDGDVEVLKQIVKAEQGEGWKSVTDVYATGDQRLITPLVMAGIFPVPQQ